MASHTTKLLKGGRPGELPVEALWSQDLVVNLQTARALALIVGAETFARAAKIIEYAGSREKRMKRPSRTGPELALYQV
jgi:hypothetical protein